MLVRYADEDGGDIFEFETNDIAGVIAAVKEMDCFMFSTEAVFYYDNMILNIFDDNGTPKQELIIYFTREKPVNEKKFVLTCTSQ